MIKSRELYQRSHCGCDMHDIRCTEFLHKQSKFQIVESEFQFDDFSTAEFKKKPGWNIRSRKQNQNSAFNGGPRNWNQKLEFPTKADWKKIGGHRQRLTDLTPPMKAKAGLIMITKLARKYLYQTKVYSTKQSPDGRKTPGQLQQSIHTEQTQFNAETRRKIEY